MVIDAYDTCILYQMYQGSIDLTASLPYGHSLLHFCTYDNNKLCCGVHYTCHYIQPALENVLLIKP